jgi:purine nucleosidase
VILDTDIGTDVDDVLALSLILCSPELRLEGVTCVYVDVALRARMALKLLRLAGGPEVPVMAGASRSLLGLAPIYWAGHEGVGLLEPDDEQLSPSPEHAVDFLVRTVMENPGEICLVAIGPLTNVALACLREPELPRRLARLVIMGGVVRAGVGGGLDLPLREHNITCDPEAAHVVLSAGAPTTLIPLDVTLRVNIDAEGVRRIRSGGTPFHDAVARQVELYPRYRDHGSTFLHDPLAVAAVIRPELVTLRPLHVDVETGGRVSAGATLMRTPSEDAPPSADVALDVRAGAFEEFLVQRLSSGPVTPGR